ncbi:MAG TPA: hypothetical protein VHM26_08125 [Chitinophagaceae bacterium]|jgi:hypothetical protein|nr:hypothetical protein [Chitinophagaceae bacterium]
MKPLLLFVSILVVISATAQKIDKEDLYPVAQKINAKWKKNSFPELSYNECVDGNCMEGEGTRLVFNRLTMEDNVYYMYFTLSKGKFEQQGKVVTGKRYDFRLRYSTDSKRDFVPGGNYDFTDPAFVDTYYVGEGRSVNGRWDGEVKTPAFAKRFPDMKVRKTIYADNQLAWIDVDLPAGHRFKSFKGRTFVSGDFLSGKAVLANGDVYEGFFFRNDFFGPGKFTSKNGKVRQGIWQFDSLLIDVSLELASFLFEEILPEKAATDYNFKTTLFGTENHNPTFYGGTVVNNVANGWGLSEFYWRQQVNYQKGIVYGQWKDNRLDGPGIIVVMPDFNQLKFGAHNSNSLFNDINYYTGIFKNGELVNGGRIYTNYSTYANRDLPDGDMFKIQLERVLVQTGRFVSMYAVEGCGMQQKGYGVDQNGRFTPDEIIEGYFKDGRISGFYFENDKTRSRKLEFLRYTIPYTLTEDIVKGVENDNNFCIDVIRSLKPQYIVAIRKKLQGDIAAAEEAKKPPPPFNPYAHLPKETWIEATVADYAKVDYDALGGDLRPAAGRTTREHIAFLEEVSKDVRKYLDETYTVNGRTYKRYSRSRLNPGNTFIHSGQSVNIAGTTVPIVILHYCQYTGSDAKAKVTLSYDGKKVENNQVLKGGSCEMITQCNNKICKTSCEGSFQFEKFVNTSYALWMERQGNWSGSRMYWVVLVDEKNKK